MRVGPLTIGQDAPLFIREERLTSRPDACRLMYVSDLHLRRNRSDRLCKQVIAAASATRIDAALLGGDLVDQATELDRLRDLVGVLRQMSPVLAVGGNHDQQVGLDRVRDAVEEGGGSWIHESSVCISHHGRTIAFSGPCATVRYVGDIRVLCAHNPRVWKLAQNQGYDLVLAGHLHGCQLVAFEYRDRLFPGAFLYPYCFLNHQAGATRLVVSRGVSDLVPVRWRCPREVVVCLV